MIPKFSILLIFITFLSCKTNPANTVISDSKSFQYKMNLEYADVKTSPLTKEDFKKFSSLNFFVINKNLNIKAEFKRTPNQEVFDMLTTTSRLAKYVKYGEANFKYQNKNYTLAIYQNQSLKTDPKYKNYLFLPFTDLTNNNESYSGGRYLDLTTNDIKDNSIKLNFNKAYNPYCAYNHKYSCPIPPSENHLDFKVTAGVKKFH